MPEMTRNWVIPASYNLPEIKFDIREPPLTGNNLGLKTWGTSYVIAKKLENFSIQYLDHLFTESGVSKSGASKRSLLASAKVLELGAGTGLVGIAAGAAWGAEVFLTDLLDIADNLLFNVEKNAPTVAEFGGNISSGVLDWREPDQALEVVPVKKFSVSSFEKVPGILTNNWQIVLAADPLYDDDHPALLANVVQKFLQDDEASRALIAIPMRDNTTIALSEKLSNLMTENGFLVDCSGEEICQDDWEASNGPEVKLRWTFWKRNVLRELTLGT
jgi:predicted nicotinamide N-methyase